MTAHDHEIGHRGRLANQAHARARSRIECPRECIDLQKAVSLGNELTASVFAYLQPIATILFAVILLGEEITLPFIIGGILAIAGARLAAQRSGESAAPTKPRSDDVSR